MPHAGEGRTLALYHLKGGVGKTATAVNLSYLAARSGTRTLLCDLDPQSSATFYLRVKPKLKAAKNVLVKGGKKLARNIKATDYRGLDLLPADWSHRHLAVTFEGVRKPKLQLRQVLSPFKTQYGLIVLDCPPTATVLAENIFAAADYVLVPVVPSMLAVRAYERLTNFFRKKEYESQLWAFFSMVERRKKLHQHIMHEMRRDSGSLLNSLVPYVADIERMGVFREPVPAVLPTSFAARSYENLWQEIRLLMGDGEGQEEKQPHLHAAEYNEQDPDSSTPLALTDK